MQVSSFIPASPPSSVPGASQGRQDERRDQGFDSVYEERAARQSGRDRTSDDAAIPCVPAGGNSKDPKPTEEQRAESANCPETEGDDAAREAAREAEPRDAAESPDIAVTPETEAAEAVETAASQAPDETPAAVAEAPARQTHVRTPDGGEPLAPRVTGEELPQALPAEGDRPAAPIRSDVAATDPDAAGKIAQPAEAVQAGAAARPAETEGIQVRRVRADAPESVADGVEPRIDTRPRDAEVRAPRTPPIAVATEPLARPVADPMVHLAADPAVSEVGPSEVRTTAEHVARAEAAVRHDTPRPVMQQIAEAARALRDGPVELTLHPEELGKVRMTLTAGADGNMTMSLQAERSETLDLLRRHIGDLARELQDLGFSNLSFSFGQDRATGGQEQRTDTFGSEGDEPSLAAVPLVGQRLVAMPNLAPAPGGLDLRL